MKISIASLFRESSHSFRRALLLCLLLSLAGSACGPRPPTETPTATVAPTSTPMPKPIIEAGGPCEVKIRETTPLSVTGMPGTNVTYRWTASAGNVNPPNQSAVTYTAPDTPGDVIIKVDLEKDGVASEATIKCKVIGPTPTPTEIEVPTPTLTPSPSPTPWECTSTRPQKLQTADIPGEVTIDTLSQGSTNVQSRTKRQVGGAHRGIPAGKYLWVFIYSPIAGLHGRYYPQGRDALQSWQPDPTTGTDGRWAADVSFGAPNECYEVIVMLAEKEASQAIADQLLSWANINHYTGYELNGPETAVPPDAPGFPDGLVEKVSIEVKTR